MTTPPPTLLDLLSRLEEVDDRGLWFEGVFVSWRDHLARARRRARWLAERFDPARPPHVGVLLDNRLEFCELLAAAAYSGAVIVGLNSTRSGDALTRDIRNTDCRLVVTESARTDLLDHDALVDVPIVDADAAVWSDLPADEAERREVTPDDLVMLIFTSGTSGDPKAVRCTHAKFTGPGVMLAERFGLGPDDTVYSAMPLFHSNAVIAGWSVALAGGCSYAIRRRFSASGFLADVRAYGVTYAHYVGKPLSYIVATPELPNDADNPLRIMYGNEGTARDTAEFARRFDARTVDGFGSTEGGISISTHPDAPAGSLGKLPESVRILDVDTGLECPPARFDDHRRVLNAAEATGELVNVTGVGYFTGYYGNEDADRDRVRDGRYHSGDLAYQDEDGFVYFAGRTGGWMRVDGENIGTAQIERIVRQWPGFAQVCVYAVPDSHVGDRVMIAVVPTEPFDPVAFARRLDATTELSSKQRPTLVRVTEALPQTATFKIVSRPLAAQRWNCDDPVWYRPRADAEFVLVDDAIAARLEPRVDAT